MSNIRMNFLYQSAYQIFVIILPIITAPYVSRVLGAEGVGTFSFTFSVANYFVLFSMLGINNYGNRKVAEVRDDRGKLNVTFSSIFSLHFTISFLVLIAYTIYILIFVRDNSILSIISVVYIIAAMLDINWFFFGMEQFKITVMRNLIIKILTAILIFILVRDKNDLDIYVAIMAIGTFISQSMVWLVVKKYVGFVKPKWTDIVVHLKPMLILFIPTLSISLYKLMDKIMLGVMSDKTQVGLFDNAEKIINIPMGLITAVGTIMLPRMTNLLTTTEFSKVEKYIANSMKYVLIVSLGWFFIISSVAPKFAPVFFGEEFLGSGVIMQGLAITIPFIAFANVIRTQYLIPNRFDAIFVKSVLIGAGINIITNLLLIPHYQALGATIATICAEISVCLLQCWAVRRSLSILRYVRESFYFILLGVTMFILIRILSVNISTSIFSLTIELVVGGLIYAVGTLLYFIKKKDSMILSIIKK